MLRYLVQESAVVERPRTCVRIARRRRVDGEVRGRRREGSSALRAPVSFLPIVFRVSADGEFLP
jgi:hypothetical protein